MTTHDIVTWFDTVLAERASGLYEHYHLGYALLAILLLNAALLRHLYPGYSDSTKSHILSYIFVVIASGVILYLATLWFRQWYVVDFTPLVFGVKIASLVALAHLIWMETHFYIYGVSSWGSRVGVEHLIAGGLGLVVFVGVLAVATIAGVVIDYLAA